MPSPSHHHAKIEAALSRIREALLYAEQKHGLAFASPHEAHSVIEEEYEELWEHVKADTGRTVDAAVEASHLAAMAVKYMINFDPRLQDAGGVHYPGRDPNVGEII